MVKARVRAARYFGGGDAVTTQLEMVVDGAVGGKNPLGVSSGLEPLHVPFAPSGWLMRQFAGVVQIPTLPVLGPELQFLLRRRVRLQLVGYDDARGVAQPFQKLAEEALGRLLVPAALDQDIEHHAVLVDRAPQIMLLVADADEHLVQEPLVARLGPAALERVGEVPAEAQAPLPDRLVADLDAARRQDQLYLPHAQAEAVVQPHGLADDRGREAEASVGGGVVHMSANMPRGPSPANLTAPRW